MQGGIVNELEKFESLNRRLRGYFFWELTSALPHVRGFPSRERCFRRLDGISRVLFNFGRVKNSVKITVNFMTRENVTAPLNTVRARYLGRSCEDFAPSFLHPSMKKNSLWHKVGNPRARSASNVASIVKALAYLLVSPSSAHFFAKCVLRFSKYFVLESLKAYENLVWSPNKSSSVWATVFLQLLLEFTHKKMFGFFCSNFRIPIWDCGLD